MIMICCRTGHVGFYDGDFEGWCIGIGVRKLLFRMLAMACSLG